MSKAIKETQRRILRPLLNLEFDKSTNIFKKVELMGNVKGLKCKECKREFPKEAIHVCEYCFGPLEVDYDYEKISKQITRKTILSGPPSM